MNEEPPLDMTAAGTITVRDPDLFYPTGDLVVSARLHDGGLHLFRIHTVILAQFSPVFADMLAMPRGAEGKETYDGVPFVHFPDDAEDIVELFRVFYRPGYVLYPRNESPRVTVFTSDILFSSYTVPASLQKCTN